MYVKYARPARFEQLLAATPAPGFLTGMVGVFWVNSCVTAYTATIRDAVAIIATIIRVRLFKVAYPKPAIWSKLRIEVVLTVAQSENFHFSLSNMTSPGS